MKMTQSHPGDCNSRMEVADHTEQSAGEIEWHIPKEFTVERPAVEFSHVHYDTRAASHPVASKIPSPSTRPALVANPDDLADLAWEPGYTPKGIKDYLNADRPTLGLRVNCFTDKTIVVLQWQQVAFDALGMQYVVEGWSNMLSGASNQRFQRHAVLRPILSVP